MEKKHLIDKYYYPIVIIALLFNIIMTWSEPDGYIGKIWLNFCTVVLNGYVMVITSNFTIKWLKNKLLHFPIAIIVSGLFAIILTYFQLALNLFITKGINYSVFKTHLCFFEKYFCEPYFMRLITWYAYYLLIYSANCIWNFVPWERPLAKKMGYVFTEDIAIREGNTITFPRKFKYDSLKLYQTFDHRIIILPKDVCDEMIDVWRSKTENEMTEDDKNFLELLEFSVDTKFLGEMKLQFEPSSPLLLTSDNNNYEIIEHDGWYELVPFNLVENEKSPNVLSKLFKPSIWLSLLLFISTTGIILKLCFEGYAFGPDEFVSQIKYFSFGMLIIFVSQLCNEFIINKKSNRFKKIITWLCSSIIILITIILLNNAYHYIPFCVQFDWPKDVTYGMFLIDDITYRIGLGWLRYPSLICFYSIAFVISFNHFIKKGIKVLKKIIIELLTDDEIEE